MCYSAPYKGNFISSIQGLETKIKTEGIDMVYLFQIREMPDRQWIKELIAEGKNVYFLSGRSTKDFSLIYDIMKKHNIGIIHTHFTGIKYHFLFNIVRKLFSRRIYLICHLHNHYTKKNLIRRSIIKVASSIDLYIGCSQSVAEHHRRVYHIDRNKITFVPNGIDFSRLDNFVQLDRTDLSINEKTRIFLMFGFDYYRKGVDLALEAFDQIKKEGGEVCLLISISSNKDFVLEKIKERFNSLPDWIKILEPRDDIATYYHFSDAFLSPSRSEGFCYSLVEAAYCEIPLIASKIPDQNYLYIPTFFEFPSEDVLALKEQIRAVLSLQQERKMEIGKIQKDFVLKTFDLKLWTAQVYSIYHSFFK
jgi:glycosyltransferase involved in cell wall biosynthesis